jgi:hypothetical protein
MSNCHSLSAPLAGVARFLYTAFIIAIPGILIPATGARAVEVLTVHELVSHCTLIETQPDGVDAQYCIRYIQGFIDGAVATDVRVMLNVESGSGHQETFSERAKRTRAPSRADRFRAAQLAGFCLGDPLPLREVVDQLVANLVALDLGATAESPARDTVYSFLREHYPCSSE